MLIPKKSSQSTNKNHDRWLLTYSDMITLLLGLFIILYSISQVDQVKYREVAKSIRSELSTDPLNPFYDTPAKSDIEDIFSQNNRIRRIYESFQYKYKNSFSGNVDLSFDKSNHLKIMIFTHKLEESEWIPNEEEKRIFQFLAQVMKDENLNMDIGVQIPQESKMQLESNSWNYSFQRSSGIAAFLSKEFGISKERIHIVSHSRFIPVVQVEKGTPEDLASQERIEIVIKELSL